MMNNCLRNLLGDICPSKSYTDNINRNDLKRSISAPVNSVSHFTGYRRDSKLGSVKESDEEEAFQNAAFEESVSQRSTSLVELNIVDGTSSSLLF